ncbi:MAG: 1-deoxy-D-xylulose-5-phosphate synthase, partial [Opitutales bacterium]|nr:1-deoxy-D-xylulose-5-phosphate synthase [Opitutales bacterium]
IDIWAIGSMVADAEKLAARLSEHSIKAGVVNARFAKPLDTENLLSAAANTQLIVTMEDHVITGGFGTAVMEALQTGNCMRPVERIGWPDTFVEHGNSVSQLRATVGLDAESIFAQVLGRIESIKDSKAQHAEVE